MHKMAVHVLLEDITDVSAKFPFSIHCSFLALVSIFLSLLISRLWLFGRMAFQKLMIATRTPI